MKKIFVLTIVAVAVLFASCEKEPKSVEIIQTTPSFTFSASTLTVDKGEQSASFTVKRGGDAFDGTVTLGVSLTGIANPAEAAAYTMAPETVTFNGNYTEGVVTITTAANDNQVTGDKKFAIKMISASSSNVVLSADSVLVTIKDVN